MTYDNAILLHNKTYEMINTYYCFKLERVDKNVDKLINAQEWISRINQSNMKVTLDFCVRYLLMVKIH